MGCHGALTGVGNGDCSSWNYGTRLIMNGAEDATRSHLCKSAAGGNEYEKGNYDCKD